MKLDTDSFRHNLFYNEYPKHKSLPDGVEIVSFPNGFLKVVMYVEVYDSHESIRKRISEAQAVLNDLVEFQGKTNAFFENVLPYMIYRDTMYPFRYSKNYYSWLENLRNDLSLNDEERKRRIDELEEIIKDETNNPFRFTHQEIVETINLTLVRYLYEDLGLNFEQSDYFQLLEKATYHLPIIRDFLIGFDAQSISPKEKFLDLLLILKIPKNKLVGIYAEFSELIKTGEYIDTTDYPLSKRVISDLVNNFDPDSYDPDNQPFGK